MDAVRAVLDEIGAGDVPELLVVNKADRAPEAARLLADEHEGAVVHLGPDRRGDRRAAAGGRRPAAPGRPGGRAGRPLRRGATCWPPCTARARWSSSRPTTRRPRVHVVLDEAGRARFRRVRGGLGVTATGVTAGPSSRRPTPTTGLRDCAQLADAHARAAWSTVGRHAVRPAAAGRGRGPGRLGHRARLPGVGRQPGAAAGRRRLAASDASGWRSTRRHVGRLRRHQGVRRLDRRSTCTCATPTATPSCIRPSPTRPTPWAPLLAGCRAGGRAPADAGRRGLDLGRSAPADADRALLLWVEPPVQPDRGADDLAAAAAWGRGHGVPVFSDECYAEFTWDGPPALDPRSTGTDGRGGRALAVQALEPGRGAGRLLRRRPRARRPTCATCASTPGSWCRARSRPPPRWPWPTTTTSSEQREPLPRAPELPGRGPRPRPAARRRCPAGGFYLWVPVPGRGRPDGWALAEDLARSGGHASSAPASSTAPTAAGLRPGGRGPADGAPRAGGRAPGRRRLALSRLEPGAARAGRCSHRA